MRFRRSHRRPAEDFGCAGTGEKMARTPRTLEPPTVSSHWGSTCQPSSKLLTAQVSGSLLGAPIKPAR